MMTRKHFEAIAQTFHAKYFESSIAALAYAHKLAETFEEMNPRFNSEKFIDACLNTYLDSVEEMKELRKMQQVYARA